MSRTRPFWAAACGAAIALGFPTDAPAADLDVEQLRRDVRELERTVSAQARRIDALERELSRSRPLIDTGPSAADNPPSAAEKIPRWLDASRWEAVRPGLKTRDVVALLGPPTAVRIGAAPEERILLYTLELDVGAFLSGTVRVANDRVVNVETPVLR